MNFPILITVYLLPFFIILYHTVQDLFIIIGILTFTKYEYPETESFGNGTYLSDQISLIIRKPGSPDVFSVFLPYLYRERFIRICFLQIFLKFCLSVFQHILTYLFIRSDRARA